ncbi:MAG TPA: hypothetical protein VGS04_05655 [Nitrososphaerales archaeon]|nr:hypothetical protein [Nitrososphaerales archaeon]
MVETASPYRRLKPLRYVAVALLLLAMASNFGGQLSLGYYLLGGAITILVVWSFAEILIRSRE